MLIFMVHPPCPMAITLLPLLRRMQAGCASFGGPYKINVHCPIMVIVEYGRVEITIQRSSKSWVDTICSQVVVAESVPLKSSALAIVFLLSNSVVEGRPS